MYTDFYRREPFIKMVVYTIVCKLILEKEKKRCILQLICFD